MGKLSECKGQFFGQHTSRKDGCDLFTQCKTGRRCTRVLTTHLSEAHFGKLDLAGAYHYGSKTFNSGEM